MIRILKTLVDSYYVQFMTFCSTLNPLLSDFYSNETVLCLPRATCPSPWMLFHFIYLDLPVARDLSLRWSFCWNALFLWFLCQPLVHQFPSTFYSFHFAIFFIHVFNNCCFAGLQFWPYPFYYLSFPWMTGQVHEFHFSCSQLSM